MKNKSFSHCLALLTIFFLAGCGTTEKKHEHTYTLFEAHSATCVEEGNIEYYKCEECGKYFDSTKENEIEEGSWVISPLGHDLELIVSGEYKTSYISGETFDPSGLEVKLACKRESCTHVEEVTDYTIVYQNEGKTSFISTDTKVTIKKDKYSKDIEVTVNKKENVITGLEEEYHSLCKEGISLEGVSATNGEVAAYYYLEEELTNEVQVDDLEGGHTYFVEVISDGLDEEFKVARKVTRLVVTHDMQSQSSSEVIGYKENVCSKCDHKETSESIMTESDITFATKEDYGMNADGITNGTNEGSSKAGCPFWALTDSADVEETYIVLPRINYSLYDNVLFSLETNSETGWGQIGLGLNDLNDLLPYADHGHFVKGIIEVKYKNSAINVSLVFSDGTSSTVTYDNEEVIFGNDSLLLRAESKNSRSVYLKDVFLNHIHHTDEGNVVPTDKIGNKYGQCECGGLVESSTKMAEADIVLTTTNYGINANAMNNGGEEGNGGIATGVNWTNGDGSMKIVDIMLPRVDYLLYDNVYFKFGSSTASWSGSEIGIGYGTAENLISRTNHGEAMKFVIEAIYDDEKLTLTATASDGSKNSVSITDENVISGKENVTLIGTLGMYRQVYLNQIMLDHVHTVSSELQSNPFMIGYKVSTCDCYSQVESDVLMNSEDITYNAPSAFGMNANRFGDADDIDGEAKTKGAPAYFMTGDILLPRVNYKAYQKVLFSIGMDHWNALSASFGLETNNDLFDVNETKEKTGTLSVEYANNKLTITYTTNSGSKTLYLEDENVANGLSNLTLKSTSESERTFYINDIELVSK